MIFHTMKYIGNDSELQSLYNTHFGLSAGDAGFWSDYASSPVFPINEEPESEDFYVVYNYRDTFEPNAWWHLTTDVRLTINSNNVKLIEDVSKRLREIFKDYEFAARRMNTWLGGEGLQDYIVNWTRYHSGQLVKAREQEDGIHQRDIRILVNATEC